MRTRRILCRRAARSLRKAGTGLLAADGVEGGVVDGVDSAVRADDRGGVGLRVWRVETDQGGAGWKTYRPHRVFLWVFLAVQVGFIIGLSPHQREALGRSLLRSLSSAGTAGGRVPSVPTPTA